MSITGADDSVPVIVSRMSLNVTVGVSLLRDKWGILYLMPAIA